MFVYNDAELYLKKDEQVINESKMRAVWPSGYNKGNLP